MPRSTASPHKFAAEMKKLGFDNLSLEELMDMKIHGISAGFVAEMQKAGYDNLTAEEITDAKIHNLSPAVRSAEMKKLGFDNLSDGGVNGPQDS